MIFLIRYETKNKIYLCSLKCIFIKVINNLFTFGVAFKFLENFSNIKIK